MPDPMDTIKDILGMTNYTRRALDNLETADSLNNQTLRNEHFSKANTFAVLALTEALTKKKLDAGWEGMDGNEHRLRPVAEVAAEVLADVTHAMDCTSSGEIDESHLPRIAAKWVTK